jgi:anti-sigma-K factor RskA
MSINSEKNMKKLFQEIYKPAVASPEFKEELFKRLADEVGGEAKEATISLWRRPKFWLAVAVVLILVAISYGIWIAPEGMAGTPPLTPPPVSPP